jgi:transposase
VFCPRCGDVLDESDPEVICRRGDMVLAEWLRVRLVRRFGSSEGGYDVPTSPMSFRVGGQWYCPRCGVRMVEADGYIRCPACDGTLNGLILSLVERHAHRP